MFYRNDSWNLGSRADFCAPARGPCDRLSACHRRLSGINSSFSLPLSCLLFSFCGLAVWCWFSLPFVFCVWSCLPCLLAVLPLGPLPFLSPFPSFHCRSIPTWCCRGYEVLWRPDILCVSVICWCLSGLVCSLMYRAIAHGHSSVRDRSPPFGGEMLGKKTRAEVEEEFRNPALEDTSLEDASSVH